MNEDKSSFQPNFERLAKLVSVLLETACSGLNAFEHHIFEALDKQLINRLLSQYDKLVKAGFSRREALDAVINLIKRRLETADQERGQNGN